MRSGRFLRYCPPIEHRALPALRPPLCEGSGTPLSARKAKGRLRTRPRLPQPWKYGRWKIEVESCKEILKLTSVCRLHGLVPKRGWVLPIRISVGWLGRAYVVRLCPARPEHTEKSQCLGNRTLEFNGFRILIFYVQVKNVWYYPMSFDSLNLTWNLDRVPLTWFVFSEYWAIDRRSSWR